jgi:hypothetical protein
MTMGMLGASEREMSIASTNKYSPASSSAEMPKMDQMKQTNGHGAMTNNVGGGKKMPSCGGGAADVSSEDIDVTGDSGDVSGRLGGTPYGKGKPDALLRGRLKLIRTHVIAALFKHPKSTPFREPVNAKALGIYPLYHNIIKNPMDLGSVRKKIDRGNYETREDCLADIDQVWTNGMTFNAPAHFVHVGAKLLRQICQDKLSRLERDEANGVYNDVLQAAAAVAKPRPKTTPKPAGGGKQPPANGGKQPPPPPPPPAGRVSVGSAGEDGDTPMREVRKRNVRKVSQDLPGEHAVPQHLKKKYVENLSEQMKQCDGILRELMSLKAQRFSVEPFLRVPATAYPGCSSVEPIDLYKIQSRLQSSYYRHPLHFANDFRRMITETYRHNDDPQMVDRAAELHHQFEVRFSKVDYEPVDDPSIYDSTNSSVASEEESVILQLSSTQRQILSIQGRDSPIVRHYSSVKNSCFVTSVNSALCSYKVRNYS